MTRDEAAHWIYLAGRALGEQEQYWFGSLYDIAADFHNDMLRHGPRVMMEHAQYLTRDTKHHLYAGPLLRRLCLFARHLAREVAERERGRSFAHAS